MDTRSLITERIDGSLAAIGSLHDLADDVGALGNALVERLRARGTLYTAGNGGSAAQALHLAEELVGRYRDHRPPVPAVCLNADPSALTCIANDFGFEQVFARQCEALLREGDVLLVLSTSGESPNLVAALQAARRLGTATMGLLGSSGGRCRPLCDHAVVVAAGDSAHVQEAHQVALHLICEIVEKTMGG